MTAGGPDQSGQDSAPRYYEIVFDMNREPEMGFLARCVQRFARRPIKHQLGVSGRRRASVLEFTSERDTPSRFA